MKRRAAYFILPVLCLTSCSSPGVSSADSSLSPSSQERKTLYDIFEWSEKVSLESVHEVSHQQGNDSTAYAVRTSEYSKEPSDIQALLSFLDTPLEYVGKGYSGFVAPGTGYDLYYFYLDGNRCLFRIQGDLVSSNIEGSYPRWYRVTAAAPAFSCVYRTEYSLMTHQDYTRVRRYEEERVIGHFNHLDYLEFIAAENEEYPDPIYALESPFGDIGVIGKTRCVMDIGHGKRVYQTIGSDDFSPVFALGNGLYAYDMVWQRNESFLYEVMNGHEYMLIRDAASFPRFFKSETMHDEVKGLFDEAFYANNALVLWDVETSYYYQRVFPKGYAVEDDSLILQADVTIAHGGWAMAGEYVLLFALSKEMLEREGLTVEGRLSFI